MHSYPLEEQFPFFVPPFKNEELLDETHLYQLSRLSFDVMRLSNLSNPYWGFFCPPNFKESSNDLEIVGDFIRFHNFFLTNEYGYPFIAKKLEIQILKTSSKLYAELTIPEKHLEYQGSHGYLVKLRWDVEELDERFVLLGTVNNRNLELVAPLMPIPLKNVPRLIEPYEKMLKRMGDFKTQLAKKERSTKVSAESVISQIMELEEFEKTMTTREIELKLKSILRKTVRYCSRLIRSRAMVNSDSELSELAKEVIYGIEDTTITQSLDILLSRSVNTLVSFRLFLEAIFDLLDKEGELMHMVETDEEIIRTVERREGDGFKEIIHLDTSAFALGAMIRIYIKEPDFNIEYKFAKPDDGVFYPLHSGREFHNENNRTFMLVAIEGVDMTIKYPRGCFEQAVRN